jgi:hypothetical protein
MTLPGLVAHTCNPNHLRGRDQEGHIWKKKHHKKGLAEWLKVYALSSNSGTSKRKKKKRLKKTERKKELTLTLIIKVNDLQLRWSVLAAYCPRK